MRGFESYRLGSVLTKAIVLEFLQSRKTYTIGRCFFGFGLLKVNFRLAFGGIKIRVIRAFRGRKSKKWGSKCNFFLKMFGSYEKILIFAPNFML